jgi:carbon storage regulator
MLILARKKQESVVVGGASDSEQLIKVTVMDIRGSTVRLGFEADANIAVHRHEVWERIRTESGAALPPVSGETVNGAETLQ